MFARSERSVTLAESLNLSLSRECGGTALDGVPNGTQQRIVVDWLRQKLDSSRFHRLDSHWDITMASDEDNWHVDPIRCDELLQFKTVELRKRNIQHQATRSK